MYRQLALAKSRGGDVLITVLAQFTANRNYRARTRLRWNPSIRTTDRPERLALVEKWSTREAL